MIWQGSIPLQDHVQELQRVETGVANLGAPRAAGPGDLDGDCLAAILALLDVQQQGRASCVCKRRAHIPAPLPCPLTMHNSCTLHTDRDRPLQDLSA